VKRSIASVLSLMVLALPATARSDDGDRSADRAPVGSVELVGHNPLLNRGMNAALAVHNGHAYVGSRTDGTHPNAGVMVVDVSDPSSPEVVGQIGPPNEGNPGETSREMRVWRDENALIVLNLASNCSPIIHACSPTQAVMEDNYRFYDVSKDKAAAPEVVSEYVPTHDPHEFYLWVDPKKKGRALLFQSSPSGQNAQLVVTDISGWRKGEFKELGTWTTLIPSAGTDNRLHSLTVSNDGRLAYLAYLGGGSFVIDVSQFTRGAKKPEARLVTPMNKRVHWGDPGAHSAAKVPGRDYMIVTDEVYGYIPGLLQDHGCPWGWTRIVDIGNLRKPKVIAEYKLEQNTEEFCSSAENTPDRNSLSSWSAHNPTLTPSLALITWHSGGLQIVDLRNPAKPKQAAEFVPEPLPAVVTEDPALSSGRDKVVMWSFPIVVDGLIYVVDIRNGLYILDYKGPAAREITTTRFLEGNSNQGDALRFEKP